MTLDEAIKHAEEVARQNEDDAIVYSNCKKYKKNLYEIGLAESAEEKCCKCAEEHRQLAEWLKELKQLREQTEWIPVSKRMPDIHNLTNGDALKTLFPYHSLIFNYDEEYILFVIENSMCCKFTLNWWNAPYKAESEEV